MWLFLVGVFLCLTAATGAWWYRKDRSTERRQQAASAMLWVVLGISGLACIGAAIAWKAKSKSTTGTEHFTSDVTSQKTQKVSPRRTQSIATATQKTSPPRTQTTATATSPLRAGGRRPPPPLPPYALYTAKNADGYYINPPIIDPSTGEFVPRPPTTPPKTKRKPDVPTNKPIHTTGTPKVGPKPQAWSF